MDRRAHHHARCWTQAAEQLTLERRAPFYLEGAQDGLRIEVVNQGPRIGAGRTTLVIRSPLIKHLSISAKGLGDHAFAALMAEGTVLTKDTPFDNQLTVVGDEAAALALLCPSTRGRLRVLLRRYQGVVFKGGLQFTHHGAFSSGESLVHFIEDGLELAKRLTLGEDFVERLYQGLIEELSSIRLNRLFKLFLARTSGVERDDFLRRATQMRNPELRFLAARALGQHGLQTMLQLYKDRSLSGQLRAGALAFLADSQERPQVIPTLMEALHDRAPVVVRTAAAVLGRWRHQPALSPLLAAAQSQSPQVLEGVACALGRLDGHESEAVLIAMLEHEEHRVRVAAVRALVQIGTPRAIAPLKRLLDRSALGSGLRYEVREAIRTLQRQGDGLGGALSLTRSKGGAVSLSAKGGGLSLPLGPRGR